MPEVKPGVVCVEWYIFNFQIIDFWEKCAVINNRARPDESPIRLVAQRTAEKKLHLEASMRLACQNFKGRWCLSSNSDYVRVHIESKPDAMMFKLTYSDVVDKITFPASKTL